MSHIDPAFGFIRHSIDDHDGYSADITTLANAAVTANGPAVAQAATGLTLAGGVATFAVGSVVIPSLPTSDPHVAGQLYVSTGAVKVSAG